VPAAPEFLSRPYRAGNPMPTHRLDRWMRAHYLQLRIALGLTVVFQLLAYALGRELMAGILFAPTSILATLVMLYLPRSSG
jgi:hypothetical protein